MATSVIKDLKSSINGVSLVPGNNYSSMDLNIGTTQINNSWSTSKSVGNDAIVVYSSFSLDAGIWIITLRVDWPKTNNTGGRVAWLSPNNATTDAGGAWNVIGNGIIGAGFQVPGRNDINPTTLGTVIWNNTGTNTVYIKLNHNAGTSLNVDSVAVHCVRL